MTATPRAPAEAATAPAPRSRTKGLLIGIGIGLIALLAAYGFGRLQGGAAGKEAEQRAGAAAQRTGELQKSLDAKQAELQRYEARRRLHLAAIALDDRNFGIAQEHVTAAGRLLNKSAPTGDLQALAAELSGAKLVASEDVGAPRSRVLGWAKKLDAALPAIEP